MATRKNTVEAHGRAQIGLAETVAGSAEKQKERLESAETVQISSEALPAVQTAYPYSILDKRYLQKTEVSHGGIGRVWVAVDQRLQRDVAFKELLANTDILAQRFWREAHLTAKLEHPSIVPIYDFGMQDNGEPFYTMKLVKGSSLEEEITRRNTLAQRLSLLPCVLKICEAVAYAHSQDIIHRDIKPSNVLLGAFGETLVIDWGLAKQLGTAEPVSAQELAALDSATLTQQGFVLGTPAYMPPEQAEGQEVDKRADVYSLGALLYHLLTGQAPYAGHSGNAVLAKRSTEEPIPLPQLVSGLSRDFVALVEKAMHHEKAQRFADASELGSALTPFLLGQQELYAHSMLRTLWQRYRKQLLGGFAAITTAVAVPSVFFWREQGYRREISLKNQQIMSALVRAEGAEKLEREKKQESQFLLAKQLVERDPRQSALLLQEIAREQDVSSWPRLRVLLADALSRGFSEERQGHQGDIAWLEPSPDGKSLASAGIDRSIRLWNLQDKTSKVFAGHSDTALCVLFSPDGKLLASSSRDDSVRLWDVSTGKEIFRGTVTGNPNFLAFSPDGTILASSGEDAQIHLWSVSARRELSPLVGHTAETSYLQFSRDGRFLVSASLDNTARLWNVSTGESKVLAAHRDWVTDVAISEQQIVTVSNDGTAAVWSRQGTLLVPPFQAHQGSIRKVAISPDGSFFVTASRDKTVSVWEFSGTRRKTLSVSNGAIDGVRISTNNRYLFFASRDSSVFVYDLAQDLVHRLSGLSGAAFFAVPLQDWLAASDDAGHIRLWSLPQILSQDQVRYEPTTPGLYALAASPTMIAYRDSLGNLYLGEQQSFRKIASLSGKISAMAFSSDEKTLAVSMQDGRLLLLSPKTGEQQTLVDAERLDELQDADPYAIHDLQFSTDNRSLFSVGPDKTIRMWDLVEKRIVRRFVGHGDVVQSVAVSPDGTLLVSASNDDTLRFWHVETGQEIVEKRKVGRYSRVRFSPSGEWLVAASYQGYGVISFLSEPQRDIALHGLPIGGIYAVGVDSRSLALGGAHGIWIYDLDAQEGRFVLRDEVVDELVWFETSQQSWQFVDARGRVRRLGVELPRDKSQLQKLLATFR